ncbi:5'-3' exonuclease H3TH domain-containing protein [Arsukibacterium sp.]|uniref:5'-3' exonuclease H3TH domain-containing protein n=1 Tax=Arsukibacterium sp. TaxID=1977258 RepID=UPI002FD91599
MARLLLIDALNVIRRLYAVQERPYLPLPDEVADSTKQQIISNTKQMLLQHLARLQLELTPSHALLVFDGRDSQWRQQRCPSYKANRKPMPAILSAALVDLQQAVEDSGIRCWQQDEYEADDIIASIACKALQHQQEVVIASTDKGFLPLLTQGALIYDPFNQQLISEQQVIDKFGVPAGQLVRFWSLVGDSTNNIPGVSGIGPKTALELMALGNTLTEALEHPDCPRKLRDKILADKENILSYMQVLSLQTHLQLGLNMQHIRLNPKP